MNLNELNIFHAIKSLANDTLIRGGKNDSRT